MKSKKLNSESQDMNRKGSQDKRLEMGEIRYDT
jgi:hypothetical protein